MRFDFRMFLLNILVRFRLSQFRSKAKRCCHQFQFFFSRSYLFIYFIFFLRSTYIIRYKSRHIEHIEHIVRVNYVRKESQRSQWCVKYVDDVIRNVIKSWLESISLSSVRN